MTINLKCSQPNESSKSPFKTFLQAELSIFITSELDSAKVVMAKVDKT